MQATNLFEPLSIAARDVSDELDQATVSAGEALVSFDELERHVGEEHRRLDGLMAAAREAMAHFSDGCMRLDADVDAAMQQVVEDLDQFQTGLEQARATVQAQSETAGEAVDAIVQRIGEWDAAQQEAARAVVEAIVACQTTFSQQTQALTAALDATQQWLSDARQATEEARGDFDEVLAEASGRIESLTREVEQEWSRVNEAIAEERTAFVSTLVELSDQRVDGTVTEVRQSLETELNQHVDAAVTAAVAELREAIERVMEAFGENTGVLADAKAVLEPLVGELDGMLEELSNTANAVQNVAERLGVA